MDPYTQNITLVSNGGTISIPIPLIDTYNNQSISTSLAYATQLGSCATMLAVVLLLTPRDKFARPSSLLHLAGLLLGAIRMLLLSLFFVTPFNGFYQVWAYDFSRVAPRYYALSSAGTVSSFFLLAVAQAALFLQAWTMVSLWPARALRHAVTALSALLALVTVSLKLALTVVQVRSVASASPAYEYLWLSKSSILLITLDTCWFCALFNVKLAHHIFRNRSLLPSRSALNPMEVLVMANGILMIIPVIFTTLQWFDLPFFEAGSFALTSIVLILPLSALAAQRVAQTPCSALSSPEASSSSTFAPSWKPIITSASAKPLSTHGPLDTIDREIQYIESLDYRKVERV